MAASWALTQTFIVQATAKEPQVWGKGQKHEGSRDELESSLYMA